MRILVMVVSGLLSWGCFDSNSGGEGSESSPTAEQMSESAGFAGGNQVSGQMPEATATEVTVNSEAESSVSVQPGEMVELRIEVFNPDQSSDPVVATLIRFGNAGEYFEVPIAQSDASGSIIGNTLSVASDACDGLCNTEHQLLVFEAVQLQNGEVSEPARRSIVLDCTEHGDPKACPGYAPPGQAQVMPGSAGARYIEAFKAIMEEMCKCVGASDPTCSQSLFVEMDMSCIAGVLNRYESQMQSQLDCAMDFLERSVRCIRNAACNQSALESCVDFMSMGAPGSGDDPLALTCGQFPAAFLADMEACTPQFTCNDGETIPTEWECDGVEDCADGSDEASCGDSGSAYGGSLPDSVFLCGSGEMVPVAVRCDGLPDCDDGSDEKGCFSG